MEHSRHLGIKFNCVLIRGVASFQGWGAVVEVFPFQGVGIKGFHCNIKRVNSYIHQDLKAKLTWLLGFCG